VTKFIFKISLVAATLPFAISSFATESEFLRMMRHSMMQMHAAMDAAPTTGDPDHVFALMMIPHHQGAIDMAKAELLYGKDPVMKRLAQEIIVDQQSEIDAMQLWAGKATGNSQTGK